MNNHFIPFKENFQNFVLTPIGDIIDNPILKQQYDFAMTNGKLLQKYLFIYSQKKDISAFINSFAIDMKKKFPDNYIFRINCEKIIKENKKNLIIEYFDYLINANILVIEGIEKSIANGEFLNFILRIVSKLSSNSQLIVTSTKPAEFYENMPLKFLIEPAVKINLDRIDSEKQKNISRNGFQYFSDFIKDIKKEAGVEEDLNEEGIREEFIEKIYVWEMKNFNVKRLKKIINHPDINRVRKDFEDYTKKVKHLIELHKEYGVLNTQHFKQEAQEIEGLLFDPDSYDIIEKKINELRDKIQYFNNFRKSTNLYMTYNRFLVDSSNRQAFNKIEEIIKKENTDNMIIITGSPGTGKTHLLNTIINSMQNDKVILIDMQNIKQAFFDNYILRFMYEMDLILIDDFDYIYNSIEEKELLKKIIMNNMPKVLTMHRKYSIEDKELLEFINSYPSFNIQPPSLFIIKNVIKNHLERYGIKYTETILNYIIDNLSIPLSSIDIAVRKLREICKDELPNLSQIQSVFPENRQKTPKIKKSSFDTSDFIRDWENDQDRLYVEFKE